MSPLSSVRVESGPAPFAHGPVAVGVVEDTVVVTCTEVVLVVVDNERAVVVGSPGVVSTEVVVKVAVVVGTAIDVYTC